MHISTHAQPPARQIGERAGDARKRGVTVPDAVPDDAVLCLVETPGFRFGSEETQGPCGPVLMAGRSVEWKWFR